MTPQQIAAIIIRVGSIFLFFQALWMIDFGRGIANIADTNQTTLVVQIIFLLWFLLIAACWFFPMTLAHYFIPNTKFQNLVQLQPYQAVFIMCVGIGLWVAFNKALPVIVTHVIIVVMYFEGGSAFTDIPLERNVNFFAACVQFLAAAFWIFKASLITEKIFQLNDRLSTKS